MGPRFNGVEDGRGTCGERAGQAPSMGPRFNGVEDGNGWRVPTFIGWPSMGPRFNGVEDCQTVNVKQWRECAFNGATL